MNDNAMNKAVLDWLDLNDTGIFNTPELRCKVAPFPPAELRFAVSATDDERHFAIHGTDIFKAVMASSPRDLAEFESILDFGCGCARLGRIFLGHPGRITGCDLDARHVAWINSNLTHMSAVKTEPNEPLPFDAESFDAIISVSVFSHITEQSQFFYLDELRRVARPGSYLFLTIHGETAMHRVKTEERLFNVIGIPVADLPNAASRMYCGMYAFIMQGAGHPTESAYDYGITFIPESYVLHVWSKYFEIVGIAKGAIHNWQDIVVCRRR